MISKADPEEEKKQEEGVLHGFHKIPDGKTFAEMPDIELASWQANSNSEIVKSIIAEKEWQRRERLEQDQLAKENIKEQDRLTKENMERQNEINTGLIEKQVRWIKFSTFITAGATLLAAILGWYLGKENQKTKDLLQQQIESIRSSEQQTKTFPCVPLKSYSTSRK